MGKITGVLVGIFYPIIVALAVMLLASVQIRSSGGSAFDTWSLNYSANRALAPTLAANYKELRQQASKDIDDLAFTELCLKFYNAEGALRSGIDQGLLDELKAARSAGKKSDEVEGELRCLVRAFTTLQYDKRFYEAKKEDSTKDIADIQKAISANSDQYTELIKGRQDYLAFKEMEKGSWFSRLIVVTPYDLMILLLVMFMGALGGMVRLLRDYGDSSRSSPTSSDYFLVPLIGLVVAIGGYVLAKTGLLLLSSNKEETSLSPFMISLVGIISGLLAKDVIDAIARAGTKMVRDDQASGTQQIGRDNTGVAARTTT